VGYSERGDVPVEPRLSEQWFVRMETLAEPALAAVRDGRIRFHPDRWVKTYNHWMENIKDWCISRQLWWGHRIPAYTCNNCGEVTVARGLPETCSSCGGNKGFVQDEDVLDTWFSSWLWPLSVFDWPKENRDLDHFYPTQSLVTGPDIIFFWVARMIMAGLEFRGDIPFSDVYFTSIIRDDKGEKLSKSKNNSPDPLDVIATYGADALRYSIIYIAPVGQDLRYSNKRCEIGRNFANKLWNAARFRQMQGPLNADWQRLDTITAADLRPDDRWLLASLNEQIAATTTALEKFDFHAYAIGLYEFVWNGFCDWYVESAKSAFYGDDDARQKSTAAVFDHALSCILRLMHPVMPFVTEEIYHGIGYVPEDDSIMNAPWPEPLPAARLEELGISAAAVALVDEKFELVRAGRNLRADYDIPYSRRIPYFVKPTETAFAAMLDEDSESLRALLNAETVTIDADYAPTDSAPSALGTRGVIYMPLEGVVDLDEERRRLAKQREELVKVLTGIDRKLSNEQFISRAPAAVVDRERERQTEFTEKLRQVDDLAAKLG
jgi:valyl-tRNA synthetase